MKVAHVFRAWGKLAQGEVPSLSIEVTKECPLRCPGCYAYHPEHLGGALTLRELSDFRGQALIDGVLNLADRFRPLHISLVGGDPLVRYRELEILVPLLTARGIHVQVVTSAFRTLPAQWAHLPGLSVAVSIDGLQPEHDIRRAPATYERILANIAGHSVIVHCTITAQMMQRPGYLEEFLRFWTPRSEVQKVWFSMFTPQVGDDLPEMLTPELRRRAVAEMTELRKRYPKLEMPEVLIRKFLDPPSSPQDCTFAQTTHSISADLKSAISPCQLGGNPDCSACGCYASMGLHALSSHVWGGIVPVGLLYRATMRIGRKFAAIQARDRGDHRKAPALVQLRPGNTP